MVAHDRAPDHGRGADAPSGMVPACAGPGAARAAAAAWRAVVPGLAGCPVVRVSPDGGGSYPRGCEDALGAGLPAAPATVPVYDEAAGTGRMVVLDLDVSLARSSGAADPVAEVAAQAAAIVAVVARLGGRCVSDLGPSGGRHVYIPLAEPLPWRELRDLAAAMRLRYPALDPKPMASPQSGQIRPPGSPHRLGGWSLLSMPLADAVDAVRRPCGPRVWSGLLDEYAAELAEAAAAAEPGSLPAGLQADDQGAPWRPRRGGRVPLPPAMELIARTGAWPAGRYGTDRSAARMAVLTAAAACGWQLADVRAEIGGGAWRALDGLYRRRGEARRLERLLPFEWRRAVAHVAGDGRHAAGPPRPAAGPPTAGVGGAMPVTGTLASNTHAAPPGPGRSGIRNRGVAVINPEYGEIRRWLTATDIAAGDQARLRGWGRQAISIRLVLTALGQAAMVTGSTTVAFGVRNLALYSGVSWRTAARALEQLRAEADPLVELVTSHHLKRADCYRLRVPRAYAEAACWRRRRAGWVTAIHPAFSELGGPAALAYAALTGASVPAAEVARTARLGETAASDALRELAACGLAERGPGGWRRGPTDLDDVAIATGAMQDHAEQAERYRADRRAWHGLIDSWLAGPDPVIPDDPAAGRLPLFDEVLPYLEPPGGEDQEGTVGPPAARSTARPG